MDITCPPMISCARALGVQHRIMSLRQPELFAVAPESAPSLYCEVAVPLPLRGGLTYAVPAGMARHVAVGVRVIVPVHGKRLVGYVLSTSTKPPPGVPVEVIKPIFHLIGRRFWHRK